MVYQKHKIQRYKRRYCIRLHRLITYLIIFLCFTLFAWNVYQLTKFERYSSTISPIYCTPLFMTFAYDASRSPEVFVDSIVEYPMSIEERSVPSKDGGEEKKDICYVPLWKGLYKIFLDWPYNKQDIYVPMFVKIREGQIWRLFTPSIMHRRLVQIFFCMSWLWILGCQIEERVKKWQYLAIMIIVGVVANTVHYLVSGIFFMGYTGVICGLVGFIWSKQRYAPWEGYPLQRGVASLFLITIVGILAMQFVSFTISSCQDINFINISHIAGALTGIALGKTSFFPKGLNCFF